LTNPHFDGLILTGPHFDGCAVVLVRTKFYGSLHFDGLLRNKFQFYKIEDENTSSGLPVARGNDPTRHFWFQVNTTLLDLQFNGRSKCTKAAQIQRDTLRRVISRSVPRKIACACMVNTCASRARRPKQHSSAPNNDLCETHFHCLCAKAGTTETMRLRAS